MMRKPGVIAALLPLLGLCAGLAHAEGEKQVPVYKLDLRKVPDIPQGNAALVAGNAGSVPDRFFLDNLYMLQPVSVTVRAVNPGDEVNVKLTKDEWNKVLREGTTGADNQVNFRFRTQGEFQISVTSPKPETPYKMVVWVGPDIVPKPAKPVFAPTSQFEGGSKNWMWWALGGAGAVILLLVGMLLGRRKAS
jgi:hypothetical protein